MYEHGKKNYGGYFSRAEILRMRKQATNKWLNSLRKNHR
jgi:hypothetical protein